MKQLYQCLDSIEIHGNKLTCRFDRNNWHILHNHDFWEIMIVTNGTYRQTINANELIIQKNTALLIKPSDIHCLHPGKFEDSHINICLNCDFMRSVCDFFDCNLYDRLLISSPKPLYLSTSQVNNISDIIQELQFYPSNKQPDAIKRLLLSFFLNLYQVQFHLKGNEHSDELKNVFRIISLPENINITVQELAERTGYSYSHFAKMFKSVTGITATEYLTKNKMEYAAYALTKLKTPILQLAMDLGYSSLGYFTNLFKKYYGVCPSEYRKAFNEIELKK